MAWFYATLIDDGSAVLINMEHICSINVNVNDMGTMDESREFFLDVRTVDGCCYKLEDPEAYGHALMEMLAARSSSKDSTSEIGMMTNFIRERYKTFRQ